MEYSTPEVIAVSLDDQETVATASMSCEDPDEDCSTWRWS